jgi:hypothetical protein
VTAAGAERRSALYTGPVVHHRLAGPSHRFVATMAMLLVDLDELPALDASLRWFGWNRARPLSLHDDDYLTGTGPIGPRLRAVVEAGGARWPGGSVRLLTQCRVFGYVFNPVSFFYIDDPAGRLSVIVADVANTFGERHPYVLDLATAQPGEDGLTWTDKKVFHVSPFFSLDGTYRFVLEDPGETCRVRIDLTVGGVPQLRTALALRRSPLTDGAVLVRLVRYPFSTMRVVAGIHWEALKLRVKGASFFGKPPYDPRAARGGMS